MDDLQFAPVELPRVDPPKMDWLASLFNALEAIFGPIGRAIGVSWPIMQWVLLALAAALFGYLVWRLVEPMITHWRAGRGTEAAEEHWVPAQHQAVALLADADRLAAEGRYGEATHLLLHRSVGQIAQARPDWLVPASTAREIAALPMLPDAGRRAFAAIATRVERAVFALRDLDAADWTAARSAYAEFARLELRR